MTKELNEEAAKFDEARERYEELAYALKSTEGQKILAEITFTLSEVKTALYGVAMRSIPFPYEYSKDELQQQKQYRSQLEILNLLLTRLDHEECMNVAMSYKEKHAKTLAGEPLDAVY